jgi:hypothetical protein
MLHRPSDRRADLFPIVLLSGLIPISLVDMKLTVNVNDGTEPGIAVSLLPYDSIHRRASNPCFSLERALALAVLACTWVGVAILDCHKHG